MWKKPYKFDEESDLYLASNAIVIAFHLKLNLDKVLNVRSFNQTFEQLNDVGYLTGEMLHCFDLVTTRQLKDCAKAVYE